MSSAPIIILLLIALSLTQLLPRPHEPASAEVFDAYDGE